MHFVFLGFSDDKSLDSMTKMMEKVFSWFIAVIILMCFMFIICVLEYRFFILIIGFTKKPIASRNNVTTKSEDNIQTY